jgi:hypothetical protein
MALVLLYLGLLYLTTVLSRAKPRHFGHVSYHFGTAAALLILGAMGSWRPLILIGVIAAVCAIQVIREVIVQLQAE